MQEPRAVPARAGGSEGPGYSRPYARGRLLSEEPRFSFSGIVLFVLGGKIIQKRGFPQAAIHSSCL